MWQEYFITEQVSKDISFHQNSSDSSSISIERSRSTSRVYAAHLSPFKGWQEVRLGVPYWKFSPQWNASYAQYSKITHDQNELRWRKASDNAGYGSRIQPRDIVCWDAYLLAMYPPKIVFMRHYATQTLLSPRRSCLISPRSVRPSKMENHLDGESFGLIWTWANVFEWRYLFLLLANRNEFLYFGKKMSF